MSEPTRRKSRPEAVWAEARKAWEDGETARSVAKRYDVGVPALWKRREAEGWVAANAFCPGCGATPLTAFAANSPVADFYCGVCAEEYELKATRGGMDAKLAPLPVGEGLRLAERSDAPAERVRVGFLSRRAPSPGRLCFIFTPPTLTLSRKNDGCAAVCSSPLPPGEGPSSFVILRQAALRGANRGTQRRRRQFAQAGCRPPDRDRLAATRRPSGRARVCLPRSDLRSAGG
ncbi:DpnI domain-containing protein [Brevundimonas sp.]|uniref:DpnI domain-containing protein n=1 Tax=Brevundimonas sp. TaxID=1871086 RepID=UPI003D12B446